MQSKKSTMLDVFKTLLNEAKDSIDDPNIKRHAYNIILNENDDGANHIHPQCLSPDFLKQRHTTDKIVDSMNFDLLTPKQADQILGGKTLSMLQYYGYFNAINSLCIKANNYDLAYVFSIGATEQFTKILHKRFNDCSALVYLLIDGIPFASKQHYNKRIFSHFIELQTLRFFTNTCTRCAEKQCDSCIFITEATLSVLGYLMVFCAENIHYELQSISLSRLKKLWLMYYQQCTVNENAIPVSLLKSLKKLSVKQITENGKEYAGFGKEYACFAFDMNQQKITEHNDCGNHLQLHSMGKISNLCGDYDSAMKYLSVASCITENLYEKVLSLRALSLNCYRNKEYLIGLIILKCTYKLCDGYILPSFVKKQYFKERKKFKTKLKRMKCSNCNLLNFKVKSCTGCMRVIYCSKRCQKKHWKKKHRNKCNRNWISCQIYFMLKDSILDRL